MESTEDRVRGTEITVTRPNKGFTGVLEEKIERDRGNI